MHQTEKTETYIGITIGPIVDTLDLTTTPAGLWGASYLFSEIARALVFELGKIMKLITPNYPKDHPLASDEQRLGVGSFPDRLLFEKGAATMDEIRNAIDDVKKQAACWLHEEGWEAGNAHLAYYDAYLQIHAVQFECAVEDIFTLSKKLLDAAELEQFFPVHEKNNPILYQLERRINKRGMELEGKNYPMKTSRLVRKILGGQQNGWQLLKNNAITAHQEILDESIRDLEDIAGNGKKFHERTDSKEKLKKFLYYAVVYSDGDNMGGVVDTCKSDGDIKNLDGHFIAYNWSAAQLIHSYGGVTIYAGGDDLLFIAPVENEQKANLFDLIENLSQAFGCEHAFGSYQNLPRPPTLSFGVSICYYKFPLYEALALARDMLFQKAKHAKANGKEVKNALALALRKHSGQSVELVFPKINENPCLRHMTGLLRNLVRQSAEEKLLSSAVHQIRRHETLFAHAAFSGDPKMIHNAFENTFDADAHREDGAKAYLGAVETLFEAANQCQAEQAPADPSLSDEMKQAMPRLRAMDSMLRLIQFFLEKGRDEQ